MIVHKSAPLPFANHTDSAKEKSGRTDAANVDPPLPQPAVLERPMDMILPTARYASAQDAFAVYSALKKAWAEYPLLEEDPRFVAMVQESYAAFREMFD